MKKLQLLLITLSILFSGIAYSQKQQKIDAILLKKNFEDSLSVKIKVYSNLFDKKLFNEASVYRNVIVIDSNDKTWPEEKWLKAKEIDYLKFKDFKGKKRVFVSRKKTGPRSKFDPHVKSLYEVFFEGELSWYRRYFRIGLNSQLYHIDLLIKENIKKPISIGTIERAKKQLLKLTKDMPELESLILKINKYDDIMGVLKKYHDNKSKKAFSSKLSD